MISVAFAYPGWDDYNILTMTYASLTIVYTFDYMTLDFDDGNTFAGVLTTNMNSKQADIKAICVYAKSSANTYDSNRQTYESNTGTVQTNSAQITAKQALLATATACYNTNTAGEASQQLLINNANSLLAQYNAQATSCNTVLTTLQSTVDAEAAQIATLQAEGATTTTTLTTAQASLTTITTTFSTVCAQFAASIPTIYSSYITAACNAFATGYDATAIGNALGLIPCQNM